MARKQPPSPTPQPANLTLEQMRAALPKLERRIKELENFDPSALTGRSDPSVTALEVAVEDTLVDIFGHHTVEYRRYSGAANLDRAPIYIGRMTHPQEILIGFERGKADAIALLRAAVKTFQEKLEDEGKSACGRALRAYQGLDLHPEIEIAAGQLYQDGHYANAIEDAVKALNGLVRLRSGQDLDGSALMERVFSPNAPILRFNDLRDQSDRDEQKGFMMMFSGAVAGLRNPRAHKLIQDDPERALEFIAFISLLAKLLNGAKKGPPSAV